MVTRNTADHDDDDMVSTEDLVRMYREDAEKNLADRIRHEAEQMDRDDDERQSER